jgi:PPOX class probable F420-dependent enzyme
MTEDEVRDYLAESKVANIATVGRNGRPHLVPVWYVPRGDDIVTWTYGSSQKVANLRRLAQATVLIESGDSYEQLRGVSMECDVELLHDAAEVAKIGTALLERYTPGADVTGATPFIEAQAVKRVGLILRPTKVVSWDHRKLGGLY